MQEHRATQVHRKCRLHLRAQDAHAPCQNQQHNEWKYLISKTGTLGDGSFVGTQSSGSFKLTGLTLPLNTELKVVAIVNPLED